MSKNILSDSANFQAKVSSVLNRNVKEFGKKFLFDGRDDTCWNSEQGSPQWIGIELVEDCTISELQIMFQGGFVGKNCYVESKDANLKVPFYPEDTNKLQKFPINCNIPVKSLKIVFEESTDFFGRVTIYQVNLISK